MPDAIEDVMLALGEYFPSAIARAVVRSSLRRGRLAEDRLDEAELGDFVEALERTLPMYIVDPERRGACVERVRRLAPGESRRSPSPTPPSRPSRDTPRRMQAARPSPPPREVPKEAPHGEPTPDRAAPGIIRVRSARDVVDVCDLARQLARTLGFNALDQTKVATAASELARNILLYAGHGEVRVGVLDSPRRGIQIVASDSGPGIPDVDRVMSNGYRSRTGMGMGLKGAKRLMDELEIDSRVGVGTTVVAKKLVS